MMLNNKPLFIEYDLKDLTSRRTFSQGKDIFKNGQVVSISLQGTTILGKTKETDTEIYHPKINTESGKISSTCTCNYNWEPICKHAVALGIAYLNKVNKINLINEQTGYSTFEEELVPQENLFLKSILKSIDSYTNFKEKTSFIIHIDKKSHRFSIFLYDRDNNEIVNNPDWYITEKNVQNRFLQPHRTFIEYFCQIETVKFFIPSRYYPMEKYLFMIPAMFSNLKFYNKDSGKLIQMNGEPLKLKISISLEEMQYLKMSSSWVNSTLDIKIKDCLHVKGIKSYVFYENSFFPVINDFHEEINHHLLHNKSQDFYTNDIPQLLTEITPNLDKYGISIEKSEEVKKIKTITNDPVPVLYLSSKDENTLQANLLFRYNNTELQATPNHADKYHLETDDDQLTYIKRNTEKEHNYTQKLISSGFEFIGKNTYHCFDEKSLDFIAKKIDQLKTEWQIKQLDTEMHIINKSKIKLHLKTEILEHKNSFLLEIQYKAGKRIIKPLTIKKLAKEKKSYYKIPQTGNYAEFDINQYNKVINTLKKLSALKLEEFKYEMPLYQGYHLYNLFKKCFDSNKDFIELVQKINNFNNISEYEVPTQVNATLRDYQKIGFSWLSFLKENHLAGILADDMGLGKTLQTITLLTNEYINKETKQSLIITPTSTLFNWEQEFAKFSPSLKILIYSGNNRHNLLKEINKYHIIITSYAVLRKDIDLFTNIPFHYCIIDEAQYIKNYRSQTAKSIKQLNSSHRLALTGTPIENKLSELWSIFDFIMPKYLYSHDYFKQTYNSTDTTDSDIEELKKRVNPFLLRRMKEHVAKELPQKVETYSFVELLEEQQAIYEKYLDRIKRNLLYKIKGNLPKNQISILSSLMKLRQICCHPSLLKDEPEAKKIKCAKFESFKEMITEIISENHKVLVFSQFVEMLDIIRVWLESINVEYEFLSGTTKNRQQCVERFNNTKTPIFLISLKAGGVGLNLTGADYVIHYDPWWNPAVENQATDRTYRIGQTKKIFSYKLITKNTIEEKIIKLQEDKKKLIDSVVISDKNMSKQITKKDLEYLLEL